MATMNLYGLKEDSLKCHIARGLLETSKHVGREKCLLICWMAKEAVPACVSANGTVSLSELRQSWRFHTEVRNSLPV